jgi:delta-aminolevulinic acid dehydratase/porphobilinogen synthase
MHKQRAANDKQVIGDSFMYRQEYQGNVPAVSRRLSTKSEVSLTPSLFGQPVDIELTLSNGQRDLQNMPGYPRRSLNTALEYIYQCQTLSLNKMLIRLVEGGDLAKDTSFSGCMNRLEKQAAALKTLTDAFPDLQFYVDPFGLALGENDQWGVTDKQGTLSVDLTERMFGSAVEAYANSGAAYVLTLGRFPKEVQVARKRINHLGSALKICTFSTNTETSQAYAYLSTQDCYHDSEQKVLPQNVGEMLLWALVDLLTGADMIIIKPSDNFHVLLRLIQLAQCPKSRKKFLALPAISQLVASNPFVAQQVSLLEKHNEPINAEYGSYAISGVYAQDMVVKERKGNDFYMTLLFERFSSIAATGNLCGEAVTIFDRSASTYLAAG